MNEDEYIEVWDQSIQELALDVRELLITDGNIFFIGPDMETYEDTIKEVAALLNYSYVPFRYKNLLSATQMIDTLETVYVVPPLVGIQRWSWSLMMHGLVVWIDPDGEKHPNAMEIDRIRKRKFPKKKTAFGPIKPLDTSFNKPSEEPPGDPLDMWQEADVHADLVTHKDLEKVKVVLGSIINAILASPPKWRGWMQQAKIRGSVAADYQTPLQERRAFHSYGVSPRLNRLLKER